MAAPNSASHFVGNLIDRGPRQLDSIGIPKRMCEAGSALIVAGNHEFNAVAFHSADPQDSGQFLRRHSDKNLRQHEAFLTQVPDGAERNELLAWFNGGFPKLTS